MTMFCSHSDLQCESDVEQKLLGPLLLSEPPRGLGYLTQDVRTKPNIRHLLIGKGDTQKRHHPDYVIMLAGIPVLIVEAKTPGADLVEAAREARLYAAELNSLFPAGLNPCARILVTDGIHLLTSTWDSNRPDFEVILEELDVSNARFAIFCELLSRKWAQKEAEITLSKLNKPQFARALNLIGGTSSRDAAVGDNTFGATIAFQYRHIFNPSTTTDREFIAKYAYIQSPRRDRYMNPLNQLIKAAVPPHVSNLTDASDDTEHNPLLEKLKIAKTLEHQVLILVGSVGAGKSTFVDRLQHAVLPADIKKCTVWVRMNLNEAPLDQNAIYTWTKNELIQGLRAAEPNIDFDSIATLKKLYGPELKVFNKGPASLLPVESNEYLVRFVDEIQRLQRDDLATSRAMMRHVCQERGRALIVVMDNCDKRILEHQLLMFQVAQWVKEQFRCLVFLPIRDVTYDLHRSEPPLDTALKDMVFRIDPPLFQQVLEKRILLTIQQMAAKGSTKLYYQLRNGMRVEYPASEQGMYLVSILASIMEHDRFIRRVFTALAGRDVRKAMEIFLEFCNSGHINEEEILKIRAAKGQYALPFHVVARVLLRMNRRFYDGDQSYLCNLLQCRHQDPRPDHLVRIAILRWLQQKIRTTGPAGVKGYHKCSQLIFDLVPYGHESTRIKSELLYLVEKGCVITEHQRTDKIGDEDLICISPSGWVHLDLLGNIDYLSACAEDLWFGDADAAQRIADRIGRGGIGNHFKKSTLVENANEIAEYLGRTDAKTFRQPEILLDNPVDQELHSLGELYKEVESQMISIGRSKEWTSANERYPSGTIVEGTIRGLMDFGIFVELEPGIQGLVHKNAIRSTDGSTREFFPGQKLKVRVVKTNAAVFKMDLQLAE